MIDINTVTENIMRALGLSPEAEKVQQIQTAHRLKLIDIWQIAPGSRVLEIGCGQGDTTAALAETVGENGFVHAIDIASGDYGAPFTLAQAREQLLSSPLGSRIRMDFECSVFDLPEDTPVFDYAVLSHCLWYFASRDELLTVLKKLRLLCRRICVAEWDVSHCLPEQRTHRSAALVQAACAAYSETDGNIRALFYPEDIISAVKEAGFTGIGTDRVFSPQLQDGEWEVYNALADCPGMIKKSDMPEKLKDILRSELELLKEKRGRKIRPLSVFTLTAE